MNKKVQKILSVLLVVMVILSIATTVFAEDGLGMSPSDITPTKTAGGNTIKDVGQQVVGILQTVGIVLSVIVLIVLGIKYMMGSTEEKSEYKKTFIPYIVGAALIFAASIFATAIYDFFSNMSTPK